MTKLFVVTHKAVTLPASPALCLTYVDDPSGDSIAQKGDYSELRAHYSAWKNQPRDVDVLGFFQFRRYLDLSPARRLPPGETALPYRTARLPRAQDYTQRRVLAAMDGLDVLAPIPEYTGRTVRDHYGAAHRLADLELARRILAQQAPDDLADLDAYLASTAEYYGNLYIMRRPAFDAYCAWLFPILEAYDHMASDIPPRTQGYLAERLFGAWFTHAVHSGDWRCGLAPRLHFWGYDDESHHLRRDGAVNLLLPPGSQLRAWVRKRVRG